MHGLTSRSSCEVSYWRNHTEISIFLPVRYSNLFSIPFSCRSPSIQFKINTFWLPLRNETLILEKQLWFSVDLLFHSVYHCKSIMFCIYIAYCTNSSVDIMTRLQDGSPGIWRNWILVAAEILLFSTAFRQSLGLPQAQSELERIFSSGKAARA
jgi:hypothetical protein